MRVLAAILLICLCFVPTANALDRKTEAENWVAKAVVSLQVDGRSISKEELESHRYLRCIRMNNYFCLMQSSESDPWKGSVGWDSAGHAVFSDPKWSVRAIVRDYCSKHRRGLDTALEVAERYSPWCDTLGTVGVRGGWGRTCATGPKPPENFDGPLCEKPDNGKPLPGQCGSCNCPSSIAMAMVRGTDLSVDNPLGLFDDDGAIVVPRMKEHLSNLAAQEIGGLRPTDSVLEAGIAEAGSCAMP